MYIVTFIEVLKWHINSFQNNLPSSFQAIKGSFNNDPNIILNIIPMIILGQKTISYSFIRCIKIIVSLNKRHHLLICKVNIYFLLCLCLNYSLEDWPIMTISCPSKLKILKFALCIYNNNNQEHPCYEPQ